MAKTLSLGVDLGNYYIKTSNEVLFESRVEEFSGMEAGSAKLVELDGVKYILEEGEFDNTQIKSQREFLLLNLYTAIAQAFPGVSKINVELALGLPITHCAHYEQELIKRIEGGLKTKLTIDEDVIDINIVGATVVPEALGVFYSLSEEIRAELKGKDVVIIDIGGRTTDTCEITRRFIVQNPDTKSIGMIHFYEAVANIINKQMPALELTPAEIPAIINDGFVEFGGEIYGVSEAVSVAKRKIAKKIINNVRSTHKEIGKKRVLIAGGGGIFLFKELEEEFAKAKLIDDIYANAKGFEKYMKAEEE